MNIFFDLDGTLLDSRERYYQVYADLIKEMGFKPLDRDNYWQYKRTIKSEKSILEFSNAEKSFDEYYLERTRRMETIKYLEMDTIWPELKPVISYISKKHLCSLITLRMDPEALNWELAHLGISNIFFLVLQPDTGFGTPVTSASKIRIMRENFAHTKMDGWIVGDTDVDILTGKELGLFSAAVSYGMQDASILQKLNPDKLFSTPKELAIWLLNLDGV
jgi:phosphoglycolate phosphatase